MNLDQMPNWAFNVFGAYDYRKDGPYKYWYDFLLKKAASIPGDIVEIGVFRGRTLCSTAHICQEHLDQRTVWGYDSFSGFPSTNHPNDQLNQFENLYLEGRITGKHYHLIRLNIELLSALGKDSSVDKISSSLDFARTSEDLVRTKLEYLGLQNVKLVRGNVIDTIANPLSIPNRISAIFLDADLYEAYHVSLNSLWPRLSEGGLVFLDEYFSLKFPGPRIAVDNFVLSNPSAKLLCIEAPMDEFERWVLLKG